MNTSDYDGRFPEPPYNLGNIDIDAEAIDWAYQKLLAFGVDINSQENAMMMDRLHALICDAC